MYYLLGYKYFGSLEIMEKLYKECPKEKQSHSFESGVFTGFGNFLNNIDPTIRTKVNINNSC